MLTGGGRGADDAFLVPAAREFAHVQPGYDGSVHLALPIALATDVIGRGLGVAHPLAGVRLTPGMVMLYGPRDAAELETVVGVVTVSHAWASGQLATQVSDNAIRRARQSRLCRAARCHRAHLSTSAPQRQRVAPY